MIAAALAALLCAAPAPAARRARAPKPARASLSPLIGLAPALREDGRAALYVDFAPGRALLLPAGSAELSRAARVLLALPSVSVSVEDHADTLATPDENQALSQARAKEAVLALEKLGVPAARLEPRGWGASRPLAPPAGEERTAVRNERLELVVKGFSGERRVLALEARDAEKDGALVLRRVPDYYVSGFEELASAEQPRLERFAGGPVRGRQTVLSYRHPDAGVPGALLPPPGEVLSDYEAAMEGSGGFLVEKSTSSVVLSLSQGKARTWVIVDAPDGDGHTVTTLHEKLR